MEAQVRRVFENLEGGRRGRGRRRWRTSCKLTVYLTDLAHFALVNGDGRVLHPALPGARRGGRGGAAAGAAVEMDGILAL